MTRTRIAKSTETLSNGTKVVRRKLVSADDLEWQIQAEAVRRIKALPGYGESTGPGVTFTVAADFNAGRRSPQQAVIAKATGIAAGEPDLRLYLAGGRLKLIEFKGAKTPISADQKKRHPLLDGLGFSVEIVRAKTIDEGAAAAVDLVRGWLGGAGVPANDNVDRAQVARLGRGRMNLEIIERAAVKLGDEVWSLPRPARHHHVLWAVDQVHPGRAIECHVQGFVTSEGRFVERTEAAEIAMRAGQMAKPNWPPYLYSEDLW